MRIGLHPGTWAAMVGIVGAGAVIVSPNEVAHAIGWVLIAIGIGIGIWGVTIDGEFWWRKCWPASSSEPGQPVRDTPLGEAIAFAITGEWGWKPFDAATSDKATATGLVDLMARIRQLCADGKLTIWGARDSGGVLEPIPADYWRAHDVEWFPLLRGKPRTEIHGKGSAELVYHDLMGSRAEFVRAFWASS